MWDTVTNWYDAQTIEALVMYAITATTSAWGGVRVSHRTFQVAQWAVLGLSCLFMAWWHKPSRTAQLESRIDTVGELMAKMYNNTVQIENKFNSICEELGVACDQIAVERFKK
jgi:hypothetical protein